MYDPVYIEHLFKFHAASRQEKADEHTSARQGFRQLADYLNQLLPDSEEKNEVIRKLQEAMFWANAAIARSVSEG
jgi:hypothetical protein